MKKAFVILTITVAFASMIAMNDAKAAYIPSQAVPYSMPYAHDSEAIKLEDHAILLLFLGGSSKGSQTASFNTHIEHRSFEVAAKKWWWLLIL
ncbi:hypothetical protein LJR030_003641 [Rhizobium sp. LjRoot30]|uniref:hypothetical protein n=1 Tax=Rhizobium sp. LjRoot30 TaxID=3342320 RepID=UPI003ECFA102